MSRVGDTIGKYEIRGELGKGGMGVVYAAWDRVLERDVALKVMGRSADADPELKQRFEREAKAVARLQHSNIVTIYDLGSDDGAPYIAMEMLKGGDLESRLREGSPSLFDKIDWLRQACAGLGHAHDNDIVHRDIKPANLFVTDDGVVKVMDFGVARLAQSSMTQTGTVLGTVEYMAPEQIRGLKVDGRADLFSLGVILYRALGGLQPFSGGDISNVVYRILNVQPPLLLLPEGGAIPELETILARALSKDPDKRYRTAAAFGADLQAFAEIYRGRLAADLTLTPSDTETEVVPPPDAATAPIVAQSTQLRPPAATAPVSGLAEDATPTRRVVASPAPAPPAPGPIPSTAHQPARRWQLVLGALVVAAALVGGFVYWSSGAGSEPAVVAQPVLSPADAGVAEPPPIDEPGTPSGGADREAEGVEEAAEETVEVETEAPSAEPATEPAADTGPTQAELEEERRRREATQRAATLGDAAAAAIADGELDRAGQLIAEGRRLDPSNGRWASLADRLDRRRVELETEAERDAARAEARQAVVRAAQHMAAGEYDAAIAAYQEALALDPESDVALQGLNQASGLKREEQLVQKNAAASARVFEETETALVLPEDRGATRGFESGGVRAERATAARSAPAEILIEVAPKNAQPGDPFVLRIRLHNESNRPLHVKGLELVGRYQDGVHGHGQAIAPRVQVVEPRSTAIVHEVNATWTEARNTGSLKVTVHLVGGASLVKGIRW